MRRTSMNELWDDPKALRRSVSMQSGHQMENSLNIRSCQKDYLANCKKKCNIAMEILSA